MRGSRAGNDFYCHRSFHAPSLIPTTLPMMCMYPPWGGSSCAACDWNGGVKWLHVSAKKKKFFIMANG